MAEPTQQADRIEVWSGEIPIESRYTAGLAGERFLRAIQERAALLGVHCPNCDLTIVPPSIYCANCFEPVDDWVELPSRGKVQTFTVLHLDPDGAAAQRPEILAVIRIDGAAGGLVHRMGEVVPEKIQIGMAVEPVFKAAQDRQGSILDIQYFRPVAAKD
ncbi:MAG: Zn-ribbon domain-containing OB-fold protein, partial [Anaerolineae bacterium]